MASPSNLQMIGLIPLPESAYQSAMAANLEALRNAMKPQGLNAVGLRAPPARMIPVGRGADGSLYALVETCNSNYRPTAVPLSGLFPNDPTKPNVPPPEFIPLDSIRNAPPPRVDQGTVPLAAGLNSGQSGVSEIDTAGVDMTDGLRSVVVGVTETQDPEHTEELLRRMVAEKTSGLLPAGGIYQRLKSVLQVVAEDSA